MVKQYNIKIKHQNTILVLGILFVINSLLYYAVLRDGNISSYNTIGSHHSDSVLAILLFALTIISRIVAAIFAYKVSDQLNYTAPIWMVFALIAPPLCLIILSFKKQNFPQECKKEALELVFLYNKEIDELATKFYQNQISKTEHTEQKNQLTDRYNEELNTLITKRVAEKREREAIIEDLAFNHGTLRGVIDPNNFTESTEEEELTQCPACLHPLEPNTAKCPECGIRFR